jgi:WD40 repeat protein
LNLEDSTAHSDGLTVALVLNNWPLEFPLSAEGRRSGDSTARIWCVGNNEGGGVKELTLKHFSRTKENKQEKSKDVTTLDWNGDGTLLATGSYDGLVRSLAAVQRRQSCVAARGDRKRPMLVSSFQNDHPSFDESRNPLCG